MSTTPSPSSQIFISQIFTGDTTDNIIIASVATGIYFLFMLLCLSNLYRDKRRLHFYLIFFCAIRVVAFSMRAYIQKHPDQTLVIVYVVLFAVGFVFLVKLLVSLLAYWSMPQGEPPKWSRGKFSLGLMNNGGSNLERLVTVALLVGAILSIVGGTDAYSSNATVSQYNKGLSLMKAGYTIYLVCIVIYLFMVVSGPLMKRWGFGRPTSIRSATMIASALLACGLLLACKSIFQVTAIYSNPKLLFENNLFYPLAVLPELGVLAIVCAPGFINHVLQGSHSHPELDHTRQPAGAMDQV